MRIKVLLSQTNSELPINNQDIVNSFTHRVLGKNNKYHDTKNDYSVSQLQGGKWIEGTKNITFKNGGYIVISSLNQSFLNDILLSLYTTPFYGDIKVNGIEFMDEKFVDGWNHFKTLSPFLIKEYMDKKTYKFLTLTDPEFVIKVKEYLIKKLSTIDSTLKLDDFDISIPKHDKHKVKTIMVKNVVNRANQCQISIFTNKKVAELLYNIGIGQSTGSGFGTIFKTENLDKYVELKNKGL